jgi:mRNA-degrading endonuclease RelE of RelBE toxin-antitoxin system
VRQLRRLTKKFPKLPQDLNAALEEIRENEPAKKGDPIPGFAKSVWKKRFGSSDLRRGKRGGFRLVYHCTEGLSVATPLLLYPKSETADVTAKEIRRALREGNLQ